jgi:hypothetical protein
LKISRSLSESRSVIPFLLIGQASSYAAQAMNMEAERKATEIRIRAERRAGELLRDMKQTGQRKGDGGKQTQLSRGTTVAPTLSDLGISRDRTQAYTTHPDPLHLGNTLHEETWILQS